MQTKPTHSPASREMRRLVPTGVICVSPNLLCRRQIPIAKTAAASPSHREPPKKTAKPPVAKILPSRIVTNCFFSEATCVRLLRSSSTGSGSLQQLLLI